MEQLQDKLKDIYDFIVAEELKYAQPVDICGWEWNMSSHIKKSFFYKHGRLMNGNSDDIPVKNITKPILNLQYWAEDVDVKDIVLYIENQDQHHLSFLVKKYHDDVFIKENNLDSLWDECNQSRIDYGLGLLMNVGKARPERIELESIAFCNQTDVINSPIGFKYFYSPGELQEMADKGWGDKANGADTTIEELIILVKNQGTNDPKKKAGEDITVYMVIGLIPDAYFDETDKDTFSYQMQIVGFYNRQDGEKQGITLFKKKCKNPFKQIKRDEVFNRACGFGGAEELFEPQVWTNYDIIRHKELLDSASKVVHITDDEGFFSRNKNLSSVENNQILLKEQGTTVGQMDTFPRNINLFEKSINDWQTYAQQMGGAPNPLMGQEAPSGTPFKLQELITQTGKNPHDFRRGQYAKFIEEVYRDWIIPFIIKEITKGQKFLSTLDLDEMQEVSERIVKNQVNKKIVNRILDGKLVTKEEQETWKQELMEEFMRDNNKFIEILKGEFKDAEVAIKINVAGKQKNLSTMTDKLVNIFRQVMSSFNPQTGQSVLSDPRMAKIFNQILEYSDLSPIDFGSYKPQPAQQPINQPNQAPAVNQSAVAQ